MSKPNGIHILIPSSGRHVCIEWASAIQQLAFPVGMNQIWSMSKADPNAQGFTRAMQREQLAEAAIKSNSEYHMWIDDDTIPSPRALQELFYVLAQRPKAAICGGIYCTKETPTSPIVFLELGGGPHWLWTLGDVFKCAGLGTGCMLVRTSILKDIPKPWFKDTSEAKLMDMVDREGVMVPVQGRTNSGTDDIFFCKKVAEAGYDIMAHGGIIPAHVDYNDNDKVYTLPLDSYPVTSYQAKLDAVNAKLPEGQKRIVL